jgi:hypothetical protein
MSELEKKFEELRDKHNRLVLIVSNILLGVAPTLTTMHDLELFCKNLGVDFDAAE